MSTSCVGARGPCKERAGQAAGCYAIPSRGRYRGPLSGIQSLGNSMNTAKRQSNKQFFQALFFFTIFCILSYLGQVWYPVFGLVTIMGIMFPLAWGKITGNWKEIGFTRQNMKPALLMGVAGGILTSIMGIAILPERSVPSQLGLQLLIGIPIWLMIASPFQAFFFRGWLQTRFENKLGDWWGLLLGNTCFTLWHYFTPFTSATPVPLETPIGAMSTFGAGLVYAYIFNRTRNIVAPWLAHVITGVTFIVFGAMDFTPPII